MASQPTLKEWLVGILIPTDVGLLIPTPQCHTFCTLDFESSVEVHTQISVKNVPVVVHSMLDLDLKTVVNPFKT